MVTLPGGTSSLRFEILGRPSAWRDGRELDLGPGKQRAVLAVLLLSPNRPVPTSSIVTAVWGDEPPDNGANVVQKYIAGLRRVLEPDRSPRAPGRLLTRSGAGYALNVPHGGLDAELFQKRVRAALAVRAAGDGARAAAELREALTLWRGTALAGLTGSFFDAARERLDEERAAALEASAEIGLELGEHARLVPELIRLVGEFPLREGFRHQLMLALYRCGRQAEALAAYRDARDFFAEEFGVEPGERLQNLHVSILRADPALALPAAEKRGGAPPPPDRPAPQPSKATSQAVPPPREPRVLPVPPGGVPGPRFPDAPAMPRFPPPGPAPPFAHPMAMPAARRLPWPLRAILVSLPLLSFGTVTWAAVTYFAARRRSLPLALAAVGYLALTVLCFVAVDLTDVERTTWWDLPLGISLLGTVFGGAVHLAILTAGPTGPGFAGEAGAPGVPLIERRVRREQARSLVTHYPSIAHRLRIGRPDLPRKFDDGGLVDVNSAPEGLLSALPGLDPYHAKLLVLARTAQGPFTSTEDLVRREILPPWMLHGLHEVLVAVPPVLEGGADGELDGGMDITSAAVAEPEAATGAVLPPEPPR
ncbi:BTAD domain-containing putative transcriptional regulator [Actinomadura sp. 7K534]|uniref:BTAD domain-containing putative transcriptional regulator n=1 Tax=Actinomadura sp. 7K534 TaxID=2530366 RepID=UPI00104EB2EF|nr:BTAD domain-containing putative transcriptional regulator [Actinomadura sp. 7K534]TDB94452.1 transcriptional regulator [Actinomadura sp. 7K534]